MTRIKAAVCSEFGAPLELMEIELRPPGPGEIASLLACGVITGPARWFMPEEW